MSWVATDGTPNALSVSSVEINSPRSRACSCLAMVARCARTAVTCVFHVTNVLPIWQCSQTTYRSAWIVSYVVTVRSVLTTCNTRAHPRGSSVWLATTHLLPEKNKDNKCASSRASRASRSTEVARLDRSSPRTALEATLIRPPRFTVLLIRVLRIASSIITPMIRIRPRPRRQPLPRMKWIAWCFRLML